MTLEQEIQQRLWRRRIGALLIDASCTHGKVYVERCGRNRYRVAKDGDRRAFGGSNTSVFTAQQEALNFILGISDVLLCTHCGNEPRKPGTSWCKQCLSNQVNNRRKQLRRERKSA